MHYLCSLRPNGDTGLLFDVLFNFHKFLRFESRDPFQEKMKREDGFKTDWDRYASGEYIRYLLAYNIAIALFL